ncbi:MAG: radical SAM protein [Butyrivibrio sp.]|nr:radical SAM protein [Butyrivibrio sp.]
MQDSSIEELWHGEKAEAFRQSMLDGSYRFCDCQQCPFLANNNLDTMLVEYSVPEYPKFCSLSYEEQCNYVCKFCRKEPYRIKDSEKECIDKIEYELNKFIDQLDTVSTNGVGEIFCSTRTMRLLSTINTDRKLSIELESNGSLFNRKNWEKISNLEKYDLTVYITVHSFNEATYQFLSGTDMPMSNVIENLHFIQELRDKDIVNHFEIATVVCESNFREMPAYVERCLKEFNPDKIRLRFFTPYKVQDGVIEWFYDIRNPYHPFYEEFVKVMRNPIFNNPKVWKWQGDYLSRLKEFPYDVLQSKKMSLVERILNKDNLGLLMRTWMESNGINCLSLYGFSNACKCMLSVLKNTNVNIEKVYDVKFTEEKSYMGYCIVSPDSLEIKEDAIIITSVCYDEIVEKLKDLDYQGKIFYIDDILNELEQMVLIVK